MALKFPALKLSQDTAAMLVSGTVVLQQRTPLENERVDVFLSPAQLRELADWVEAQRKEA